MTASVSDIRERAKRLMERSAGYRLAGQFVLSRQASIAADALRGAAILIENFEAAEMRAKLDATGT